MSHEHQTLSIQLLDKTWQIRCPNEKAHDLLKSAHFLDEKMHEIANQSKPMSHDRLTIIAAIQAIYELMAQQSQKDIYIDSLSSRIRELQNKMPPSVDSL
jgi:cell division protein ZapA